ncbi:P-loop containing nucleoside triphosphate hydrolase protein [Tricholoma matsutake]|nr:P-loop containing nucleoside triphosphate hydrolase protein [Tricholoma matsutake 945]
MTSSYQNHGTDFRSTLSALNSHPSTASQTSNANGQEQIGFSLGYKPRNVHGIRLRPISDLPDAYRGIFKFGVFNAVQSTCFNDTPYALSYSSSAPTGSGKTVLFELAIIRMLTESRSHENLKCVYIAPTKALCSERFKDWAMKFEPLGIKCCELTGDTVHFGKGTWGDAKNASIIISTGEKWDSLTRNWLRDHGQILSQIRLFLVDEVHILNETRGSTLEVVISRMKTRGSAVRFVLVSATVPNIEDISSWIASAGNPDKHAKVYEFGEEFRPCKLTRVVIGVPRPRTQNDFVFNRALDYKLFGALQRHSVGKPILVFCSTRKGVFSTADQLLKEYIEAEKNKQPVPWSHPSRIEQSFSNDRLAEFASFGIGVHHAGLTLEDRRATEDLYLRKILRIIVATSTLAVGVNLPAHMVVIKGVRTFQNNASVEYSDLDIMQMLGRAGRPQFDKDGIAIILCEQDLENKYRALVQGQTTLESCLHTNLSEHLNSEIGLGTITSITSAKEWLRGSFLFQRIRKNPKHYALRKDDTQTWEDKVEDLVTQSVAKLRETQLIEAGSNDGDGVNEELVSTEYGDIMSKLYIRQLTMGLILRLPKCSSLRDILEMISTSEEFSDVKIRASEKTALNKLRKHNDIRFEISKLEKSSDKVFLLIQAVLSGISLNDAEYRSSDSHPQLEAFGIFRHVTRIARAIVDVGVVKKFGSQVKHGLELVRCLTAKSWEDRPIALRQVVQIGDKSYVLAEHGITSLAVLQNEDPLRIEALLNRRPPFGLEVIASAREFPRYRLKISELGVTSNEGQDPVEVELSIECGLDESLLNFGSKKVKGHVLNMTALLTLTSDMDFIDFRRIPTRVLKDHKKFELTAQLTRPSQSVLVIIASETFAGTAIQQLYKPRLSAKEFPVMNTRPPTSINLDLAGLEEDPDFWNMDLEDEEVIPIRDLTKNRTHQGAESKTSGTPSSKKKQSNILRTLDPLINDPEKLVNGNYECNHTCKDKTICRHLCCREGVGMPSKKRSAAAAKQARGSAITKPKTITAVHTPAARRFNDLEELHEKMNVTSNLGLPQGHRLKLDSPEQLRRKRRPFQDFNIDFADLNNTLSQATETQYDGNDTDNDDLPESHDILKTISTAIKARTPPLETNYSDSDLDSLIRAAPLDDNQEVTVAKFTMSKNDIKRPKHQPRSLVACPSTPLPTLKRNREACSTSPPFERHNKLPKTVGTCSSPLDSGPYAMVYA